MPPPASSENDLRRRARRRLIGAIALTLVAVSVLPLLLEDEPPPASSLAVRMTEVPRPAPPAVAVVEQPLEASTVAPTLRADAVTDPVPAPSAPLPPPPAAVSPPPPVPLPKPEVPQPVPKAASPAAEKSVVPPPPKPQPKSQEAAHGYVVQLAALSDETKADALKKRAAAAGVPAYTDMVGTLTRVRVGPYTSREAAVAAAVKLAEHGINGQIVAR